MTLDRSPIPFDTVVLTLFNAIAERSYSELLSLPNDGSAEPDDIRVQLDYALNDVADALKIEDTAENLGELADIVLEGHDVLNEFLIDTSDRGPVMDAGILLLSDQPVTCGLCGSRTDWVDEGEIQRHTCLGCGHAFDAMEDPDGDEGDDEDDLEDHN